MAKMQLPSTYTLIEGVRPDDVPEHIRKHWNSGRTSLDRTRALQGAFAAHVKAWRAILDGGDVGAIVLEDDCIYYRWHPLMPDRFPPGAITLLGGCFRSFGKCGQCETSFISQGHLGCADPFYNGHPCVARETKPTWRPGHPNAVGQVCCILRSSGHGIQASQHGG